jgi:hypothetical protein
MPERKEAAGAVPDQTAEELANCGVMRYNQAQDAQ